MNMPRTFATSGCYFLFNREASKMNFKLALVLILGSMSVLFIAQNSNAVEIGFLYWRASMSSALLIFFSLLIGFLLGWSLHSYLLYRKSKDDLAYYR
jgi:uncharacterized integral membrane protein